MKRKYFVIIFCVVYYYIFSNTNFSCNKNGLQT